MSKVISFRINPDKDKDIVEYLERFNSNGEAIKHAIRNAGTEDGQGGLVRVRLTGEDKQIVEWLNSIEIEERSEFIRSLLKAHMIGYKALESGSITLQPTVKESPMVEEVSYTAPNDKTLIKEMDDEENDEDMEEKLDDLISSI